MNFHTTEYLDELDDVKPQHQRKGKRIVKTSKRATPPLGQVALYDPVAQLGIETEFKPTFHASRFERAWLLEYLGPFYEDHYIADVLRQVKGGKEATVYCCLADPRLGVQYLAAKVYRPKIFRTLKNDAEYRQGRTMVDDENQALRGRREKLAIKKKSEYGQELLHKAWLTNEYAALLKLRAAGIDVVKPLASSDNVILMEFFGEPQLPAPTLNAVHLARDQAQTLFERVVHAIDQMLAQEIIHADLSAFNILYWDGDIRIIDFPQAVNPYVNPKAFTIFERDVARVCEYFAHAGVRTDARQLARELWRQNVNRDPLDAVG